MGYESTPMAPSINAASRKQRSIFGAYQSGRLAYSRHMTSRPIRIPEHWPFLRVGEQMHTRLPLHRLEAIAAKMAEDGYRFRFDPNPTGYFVVCEARPPIDPVAEAEYVKGAA